MSSSYFMNGSTSEHPSSHFCDDGVFWHLTKAHKRIFLLNPKGIRVIQKCPNQNMLMISPYKFMNHQPQCHCRTTPSNQKKHQNPYNINPHHTQHTQLKWGQPPLPPPLTWPAPLPDFIYGNLHCLTSSAALVQCSYSSPSPWSSLFARTANVLLPVWCHQMKKNRQDPWILWLIQSQRSLS